MITYLVLHLLCAAITFSLTIYQAKISPYNILYPEDILASLFICVVTGPFLLLSMMLSAWVNK